MTMISNYYAQVGVGIDKSALKDVRNFLNNIESQFKKFQGNLGRSGFMNIKVRIDKQSLMGVQRDLNGLSKNLTLRISNVTLARGQLNGVMRNISAMGRNGAIQIRATLSESSLHAMRAQVRSALAGVIVTPVAGRIRTGGGGSMTGGHGGGFTSTPRGPRTESPHVKRNFSPWYNPMMIGGGVGAFLRYGAYSLPFVAGAMGLNALAGTAGTLQGQQMMLNASTGSRDIGASQMQYLSNLGDRLGIRTSAMVPGFAQMAAGVKGTALESGLPRGFESFMMYSSVLGLNEDQKGRAIKALSQMIAKRSVQSEELRGQLAEAGMPMAVQMMANAVAGGDVGKLQEMMKKGEVDPIKALPKFFDALRAEAEPFMADFYNSLTRWQGKSQKATEDWMKKFLGGGGTNALTSFFQTWTQVIEDSIPFAERLGKIFSGITHYFNAALLVPGEIADWLSGGKNNFMQALFGDVDDNTYAMSIMNLFKQISDGFKTTVSSMSGNLQIIVSTMTVIGNVVGSVLNIVGELIRMLDAYSKGGSAGLKHEFSRNLYESQARQQAIRDLNNSGMDYDVSDVNSVTRGYMMEWDRNNPAPANIPPSPGTRSVWGGALGEGVDEVAGMMNSGTFSWGGLWDVLNKDRSYLLNAPSNSATSFSPSSNTLNLHITQDPINVNATVDARSDAEIIANEVTRRVEEMDKRTFNTILTLSPMTMN